MKLFLSISASIVCAAVWLAAAGPSWAQAPPRRLPPVEELPAVPAAQPATSEADIDTEDLPIDEPDPNELPWYSLQLWTSPVIWDNSFELGLSGSGGNTDTLSLAFGTDWNRKLDWSELAVSLNYNKVQANGLETKHNAILSMDHKWLLGDSPWSLFAKSFLAYDEFKAFDLRLALNGGGGYSFYKSDTGELTGRFGAGTSREFGGPDKQWVPEAVFGTDMKHQISDRQKLSFTTDYFPNWTDFTDYRLVSKATWEIVLDEDSNLSFKINIIDRYDSTPNGAKPNDIDYAFLLLWTL